MVLPWLLILAVLVGDITRELVDGQEIRINTLLVAAPATAAIRGRARYVLVVSVAACLVAVFSLLVLRSVRDVDQRLTVLGSVLLMGVVGVGASAARQRGEERLSQVRRVAEAAQLALLRPMPRRLGELRLSARYLAAERESRIGGDLYEAVVGPRATRLIIGDVRGKGLPAVLTAGAVLGAFREAARHEPDLDRIALRCSEAVTLLVSGSVEAESAESAESAAGAGGAGTPEDDEDDDGDDDGDWPDWGFGAGQLIPDAAELFVTALVIEFDGPELRLISLGHPPPVLLTAETAEYLQAFDPVPPLGMAHELFDHFPVYTCTWRPGDRLLFYTDGIVEARDSDGRFFPLRSCLETLLGVRTAALPDALLAEVTRHTGGELGDDAAIVAVEWSPTGAAGRG